METRREFLLNVVKGTVYSVPVIRTLATPPEILAQGESQTSEKGGMGMHVGGMGGMLVLSGTGGFQKPPSSAPWATKPPGGRSLQEVDPPWR